MSEFSEFIDREKAIAKIKAAYCCGCENYNGVRCRACQIMDAIDVLEDEPAVVPDVLRPVAHWNMDEDAVGDPIVWTCSNCKDSIIMYDGTPKVIFGGGLILSDRAAAERAAAERAAAERAAATKWELSARERAIVEYLNSHEI